MTSRKLLRNAVQASGSGFYGIALDMPPNIFIELGSRYISLRCFFTQRLHQNAVKIA